MKRILLSSLLVATLPFGSVLADAPKSKDAKVTIVYQHELPNVPGKSIKGVLVGRAGGTEPVAVPAAREGENLTQIANPGSRRTTMHRLSKLTMSTMTVLSLGLALLPGTVIAQQKSLKEQLVGTWTFVTATEVQKDGTKVDRWGPNPKGILIFDANGRYVLVIHRADLPKFAANRVDQGTAEENKAVMRGLIVTFGTYSVNEGDKAITTQIEGGSFPNLYGKGQKRTITSLTATELKYTNPASTIGATAQVVWKRAK